MSPREARDSRLVPGSALPTSRDPGSLPEHPRGPTPGAFRPRFDTLAGAYALLLEDRLADALQFVDGQLEREPDNPHLLVLKATAQMYLLDFSLCHDLLDRARARAPSLVDVGLRQGDLEMLEGSFQTAESTYRKTLKQHPGHPLLSLNLAISLLQDQRRQEGEAVFRAAEQRGNYDRESQLTRGLVIFLLGDHAGAQRAVEEYEAQWGPCSSTRFLLAMIRLRATDLVGTKLLLEEVSERAARTPSMIQQVANLYLALGEIDDAHALLSGILAIYPEIQTLRDQFEKVDSRFKSEHQLESRQALPLQVGYDSTLSRKLVNRIIRTTVEQANKLIKIFGKPPGLIPVKIFASTGFSAPAYYNNLTGEVIVSGQFFQNADRRSRGFVDHALAHEMAHYMVWSGRKGFTRSVNSLWLDEGLAEVMSGGVGYLKDLGTDFGELFADGPLSMSDLIGNINVLWSARTNSLKGYVQSYYMVEYLMSLHSDRERSLSRVMQLLQSVSADVPLRDALAQVFELDIRDFEVGWKSFLKKQL